MLAMWLSALLEGTECNDEHSIRSYTDYKFILQVACILRSLLPLKCMQLNSLENKGNGSWVSQARALMLSPITQGLTAPG